MNLPRYSLDNRKVIFFFLAILLVGGIVAFTQLGKKEDSPFVIKSAAIVTRYPGATPEEVEQLITEPIEREIQSMRRVYKITSESWYGMSKIMIELQPSTPAGEMPQMWDELRRKIMNVQPALPDGASNISVSDDFGDVFGIYYGLSADEGFTYEEMRDWAQRIKTELVTVPGVQKVTLFGEQNGVVNVYLSMSALGNLFITPDEVIRILSGQNTLVGSGEKMAGQMQIKIIETGTYKNLDDIRNQILTSTQGLQVRLGDIARIEAGYAEPPGTLMRVNGRRAIGIGVSTDPEKDVVKTGALIERKLAELNPQIPIGITLQTLYPENQIAREANNTFIVNLIESISIVIVLIMLIMGLRAGILIGSSLIFAIGGTLLIMQFLGVGLNRTSLAGFIIAMGMLVDNAIVVTDNAQNAILRGARRRQALIDGATGPQWGLLGATFIAICSFLPLYLAPSAVAEIVKPLFVVVAISLLLSWMLALSQTPLFGSYILKEQTQAAPRDPYDRKFYRLFDQLLERLIRRRWWVAGIMVALFAGSLLVMGAMPQNFFPNLDKPYFRADCFLPDGYNIRDMERNIMRLEEGVLRQRLGDDGQFSSAVLPGQHFVRPETQFRQPAGGIDRERLDGGGGGAFQRLCPRQFPRPAGTLVAVQTVACGRSGHRNRIHRSRHRHARRADRTDRKVDARDPGSHRHPQQLGQPDPGLGTRLFAGKRAPARHHATRGSPADDHRHLGLPTRRVPS